MGVNNLLPNILPSIGKRIDLVQASKNLERCSNCNRHTTNKSKRRRLDKGNLRIAIDVSIWISQACHGNGSALIDERQLSNYGRAELRGMDLSMRSEKIKNKSTSEIDANSNNANNDKLNEKENEYISICSASVVRRIEIIQQRLANCELLVVFDGKTPPLKEKECRKRREAREKAILIRDSEISSQNIENDDVILMKKAKAARKAGAGVSYLYKKVVLDVFSFLRNKKIPFLVSPYESDSQLAYLSKKNLVDLILTEDSDLIAYGAKSILFKVDKDCKSAQLLERKEFAFASSKFSLIDFSDSMLACMFVAAGCDYCNSLPGIGIGRARDIIQEAFHSSDVSSNKALERVFQKLYSKSKKNSSRDEIQYEKTFLSALIMYRNAIVFDPITQQCVHFSDDGNGDRELLEYQPYSDLRNDSKAMEDIVGVLHADRNNILNIVEGRICPRTLMPY